MGGLKTHSLRMARHSANGMAVARYLEAHEKVAHVTYPGLEAHPRHQVACQQMSAFSGMITSLLVWTPYPSQSGAPNGKMIVLPAGRVGGDWRVDGSP